MTPMTLQLADYGISSKTGFLPERPIASTAVHNRDWHQLAANLPKALATGALKVMIEALPEFVEDVETPFEMSMRTLSYLGHAYLWGDKEVPNRLPKKLARAWVWISRQVGRPPILSYPSYCLYNFRLVDASKPAYLGNIEIAQNFLGGLDEDWFILIHVDIEARAAQAIRAVPDLLFSAYLNDAEAMKRGLQEVRDAMQQMNATMNRMPEGCDPYIYYTRVRPYIFGTKNNPALPDGLIYGDCFDGKPQFYRGETGAQSSIVPALDGLLGVTHQNDPLKEYLLEMRTYMVPEHQEFIERVENESLVRRRVQEHSENAELTELYNACVDELFRFRAKHLEYAASYIHKQSLQANNSNSVGTGGTPFMDYLAKHRDETKIATLD